MKAVIAEKPGGPEELKLTDIDTPEPGPGELLVEVRACALNPVDYKIRGGYLSEGRRYPAIYGYDVSGVVVRTGGGTAGFSRGDEVYYYADLRRQGAYAQYHVVDAAIAARKPAGLGHVEAASLPLAATTAWQGLFGHARLEIGETVLIAGAAGGVGSLAVQMAAWRGARVIGVCSASNLDYVRSLGADRVIDYGAQNVSGQVAELTGGAGVDVAFDLVGGDSFHELVRAAAPMGRLVFLNAFMADQDSVVRSINAARIKNLSIHCELARNSRVTLEALARLAGRGYLRPQVDQVIALPRVAEGHRRLEARRGRGKIVIDMTLPP